jgi:uncharacterized protein (DUF2252 family)
MRPRLVKLELGLENAEGVGTPSFPVVRLGANVASALRRNPAVGMGTKNFITEILDTYAALSKDRRRRLIAYSSQLADEQRGEQRAAN